MTQQAELDFDSTRAPTTPERANALVAAIDGRGWVTARELHALGFTDRELRQIAEDDDRVLIFSAPGARGYKLFAAVDVTEFSRGIAAWRSQIRNMERRVSRYLRAWHRLGRPQL